MRPITRTLWTLLALLFLFEEWVWRVCGPAVHAVIDRLPLAALKRGIARLIAALPPYAALLLFVIPAVVIFPFKLAGLWLFAHGRIFMGAAVFLAAKAVGFGIAAFLFDACKPKLMRIGWFASAYDYVLRISAWAHEQIAPLKAQIYAALARLRGRGAFARRIAFLRRRASR